MIGFAGVKFDPAFDDGSASGHEINGLLNQRPHFQRSLVDLGRPGKLQK